MTRSSLFRDLRIQIREYGLAVLAAYVIFFGLQLIISSARHPLAGVLVAGTNAIVHRAFRDTVPLANPFIGLPWQYYAKTFAEDIIVLVVGIFMGLWANARNLRKRAQ